MGFEIKEYKELTKRYDEAVLLLNGNHRVDSKNDLPDNRKTQVDFLDIIRENLDKDRRGVNTKALIFSGAMHIIRSKIGADYNWRSPENSMLYKHLSNILGLQGKDSPSPEEAFRITKSAHNFIKELTFTNSLIFKGMKPDHPFISLGEQFNVIWKECTHLMKTLSDEIVEKGPIKLENDAESVVTDKSAKQIKSNPNSFFDKEKAIKVLPVDEATNTAEM